MILGLGLEEEFLQGKKTNTFTPNQLSGLVGFWRADMGVTAAGGKISAWADQSGNAYNLTQGTSAQQPTYSATGFNTSYPGISCVAADGKGLASASISPSTTQTFSVAVLGKQTSAGSNARIFSFWSTDSDSDWNGGPGWTVYEVNGWGCGAGNSDNFGNGGSSMGSSNTPELVIWTNNGTIANAYLNGAVQGAATNINLNFFGPGNFYLGTDPNGAGDATFTIAFVVVTAGVMSAGDIANLKAWCNANWGTSF
jgi:hypothetical protein